MSIHSVRMQDARTSLMLPLITTEADAYTQAMDYVDRALENYTPPENFPSDGLAMLTELKQLMDTQGLVDPDGIGLHAVKAKSFTLQQRERFSAVVDELAFLVAEYSD
ncbi:hypothetical protein MOQ19_09545 [Stenotrophomonas maltophilia]|nr:hypothetical protein [Stenotrophomonas maltophilia]